MLIDFDQLEEKIIPNFYGGEKETCARIHLDDLNKITRTQLAPGASIGLHTHDHASEMVFVLAGIGYAIFDGVNEPLSAGICHYCPKGHSHSLINNSSADLLFYTVVAQQ